MKKKNKKIHIKSISWEDERWKKGRLEASCGNKYENERNLNLIVTESKVAWSKLQTNKQTKKIMYC